MITSKFPPRDTLAFQVNTKERFEAFWNTTLATKGDFDLRHEHGASKIAGEATKLASSASVVWSDIAPILDIISDVGGPYTGIAIGTIAFMLTVAKNRENMENRICATLGSIRDRLPGIEMYQRIYRNNGETSERLRSTIISAYDCFIQFCIAAVKFYTMNSVARWLRAIRPSTFLDVKVSAVEQAIVNVRLVCEEMLTENIADVKRLNEEQAKQIDRLIKQVEGRILKLDSHSPETELANLERHRNNIAAEFKYAYPRQQEHLISIKKDETFQSWRTSADSRILLLVGRNKIRQARNCWLSPLVLDFISECDISGDPCVFYLLGNQTVDDTFDHVASSLIFRLLSMNRNVLRDEKQYAELHAELQSYESANRKGPEPHIVQELLKKVALRTLNMFHPSKVVWIVLDRLDQCRGTESRNFHRKTLLKLLVKLVEDENLKVRVRVLALVNGVDWMPEEHHDEIDRTKDGSVMFWTLEQNQYVDYGRGIELLWPLARNDITVIRTQSRVIAMAQAKARVLIVGRRRRELSRSHSLPILAVSRKTGLPSGQMLCLEAPEALVGTMAAYALEIGGKAEVTAVMRSNYVAAERNGIDIDSIEHGHNIKGWRPTRIRTYTSFAVRKTIPNVIEEELDPFDFVVVATKNIPELPPTVADIIEPAVTAGRTAIVLSQNGLNIEKPLIDRFPTNPIISSISYIAATETLHGKILHDDADAQKIGPFNNPGVLPEVAEQAARRYVAIYNAENKLNITYEADVKFVRWHKLLYNSSYNSVASLLRMDTARMRMSQHIIDDLIRPIMLEIMAAARANGVYLTDDIPDKVIRVDPTDTAFKPSMCQDAEKGNFMEIETIVGEPLREGEAKGVPMPTLRTIYGLLKGLQLQIKENKGMWEAKFVPDNPYQ
ncbi:hypothetical protein NUW58_g6333 [Xylaria curta]|uniref:Uncharacterized protein n=1 Tax=Xylaria curta TaxID=42375 RepID=A0ACC1NVM7_9PEZI|nr:hypothetical protein NUW58_g6333 [Xylaria curta]